MDLQRVVLLALQASVFLTLFGFGLQATRDDLLFLARRPAILGRSLLAMFVVMPVLAVLLARLFSFRPVVNVALVALAISPVPPLLPKKTKAVGDASFALGLVATSALLSILVVPLALEVLGRYFAQPLHIAPGAIVVLALKTVLVPLLAGMLVRFVRPSVADRVDAPIAAGAGILLAAGIVAVVVGGFSAIRAQIGDGTVAAMVTFVVAGLIVGHLVGGPDREDRIVLALSTACRHPGVALAIVAENFPGTRVGATLLLFLLVSTLVCLPYIAWQRRLTEPAAA